MSCPNCKARQPWSDECRRCKCDFTILRRAADATRQTRRACLRAIRAGRYAAALTYARRYRRLQPHDDSARLLAVCHLLCGQWHSALLAAQEVDE